MLLANDWNMERWCKVLMNHLTVTRAMPTLDELTDGHNDTCHVVSRSTGAPAMRADTGKLTVALRFKATTHKWVCSQSVCRPRMMVNYQIIFWEMGTSIYVLRFSACCIRAQLNTPQLQGAKKHLSILKTPELNRSPRTCCRKDRGVSRCAGFVTDFPIDSLQQ